MVKESSFPPPFFFLKTRLTSGLPIDSGSKDGETRQLSQISFQMDNSEFLKL